MDEKILEQLTRIADSLEILATKVKNEKTDEKRKLKEHLRYLYNSRRKLEDELNDEITLDKEEELFSINRAIFDTEEQLKQYSLKRGNTWKKWVVKSHY